MQARAAVMVMALMMSQAMPALAADGFAFELSAPQQSCVAGIKGDNCHHFFAQDKVQARFTARPMKANEGCPRTRAELVQLSSRLEAPLPDAVTPATASLCGDASFTVEFPGLTAETDFEIVFSREEGKDKWRALESIPVKVYPRLLMDDVKSWAAYKDNALVVRDKEGRFTEFLDRHRIGYVTREPVPAGARRLTIVTGKDAAEVEGDAIYLLEQAKTFPLVRVAQSRQGKTVTVEMKLVDALAADEPLAQKMFAEIFREIAK